MYTTNYVHSALQEQMERERKEKEHTEQVKLLREFKEGGGGGGGRNVPAENGPPPPSFS